MEGEREKEKEREEETRIREKKGDFCCEIFSISWRFKEKSIQQLEKIVFFSLSLFFPISLDDLFHRYRRVHIDRVHTSGERDNNSLKIRFARD